MKIKREMICGIPALIWGQESDKAYVYIHGKSGYKEYAEDFAQTAEKRGYQTLSFDLPAHGERKDRPERCDIWSAMDDLNKIADFAFDKWRELSLFACSIGAYFALNTYSGLDFRKCLFQSPIVDMNYLVNQMFKWFGITPERLKAEGEIETPVELLSWKYYCYSLDHPVERWEFPTAILYAGMDNLQSEQAVRGFCEKFSCSLTVAPDSLHPFMESTDKPVVQAWLDENI